MGKINGFLEIKRENSKLRLPEERIKDYKDITIRRKDDKSKEQAARCMDCGTPFCTGDAPSEILSLNGMILCSKTFGKRPMSCFPLQTIFLK